MKYSRSLFFFLMLSVLFSCETEIPFDGTVSDPVLVVNCIVCTDSVIRADVSVSRFFLDEDGEYPVISNATVALYVNGSHIENLSHIEKGMYQSNYKPLEGENIRLNVSALGYEPVWAEIGIPTATFGLHIDSTITKSDTSSLTEGYYGNNGYGDIDSNPTPATVGVSWANIHKYKLTFNDPPGENNYYRLVMLESTQTGDYTYSNYLNDFDDIVFGSKNENLDGIFTESEYDRYTIFSDELIDGKSHTITINYHQRFNKYYDRPEYKDTSMVYERSVTFDLQAISRSYFLYLSSLKALAVADPFMSEPVQVYTNINGGLGIMGARTNSLRKFVLPE